MLEGARSPKKDANEVTGDPKRHSGSDPRKQRMINESLGTEECSFGIFGVSLYARATSPISFFLSFLVCTASPHLDILLV